MLTAIRSAGVAPEVNLWSPLHASDEAPKQGSALILKPIADVTRNPKQEYQWPHKSTDVLQIFFLKKVSLKNKD